MRIGLWIGGGIDDVVEQARRARDDGFPAVWLAQIFGVDALTAIAVAGREVPDVHFGTSVVPTYPRHPAALAQQALTASAATGGRLTLGIGLSHQVVIEGVYGMSFERPVRHMREHLSVLVPLLAEGQVNFAGETITARARLDVPGATPPPVLVAALGPQMLRLAGSRTDGTVLWMTGPRTVEDHIAPTIAKAAADAGRPAPRIACCLPVCVTADVDAAKERAARQFAAYGGLPSYRAMLDREGVEGPADVAVIGDESAVAERVRRIIDAGATEFGASIFGSREERDRTREVLRGLL